MSDTKVFAGVTTYFVALTTLLALSGISSSSFFVPGQVDAGAAAAEEGAEGSLVAAAGFGVTCGAAVVGGFILGFLTFGLTTVAAVAVCAAGTFLLAHPDAADPLIDAFHYIFQWLGVFFQLLTFQLPIPSALNAVMVLPAAGVYVYLGIKMMRGLGG